jgi:small subunit ribosomal protein S9
MVIKKEKAVKTKKPVIKKPVNKGLIEKKPIEKIVKMEKSIEKEKKPTLIKKVVAIVQKKKESELKIWTTGKRKSAIAGVQFFPQEKGEIIINGRKLNDYFSVFKLREIVLSPLKLLKLPETKILIKVVGGGITSQAEAIRLGISRALISINHEQRKDLKSAGFLHRDPRIKERKKPGLKRARRAPQWNKR